MSIHPESGMTPELYDCLAVPLTPAGPKLRLVVATHGTTSSPLKVGVGRDGTVYELFVSTLPSPAFTCSDVLDLYLHRGSFDFFGCCEVGEALGEIYGAIFQRFPRRCRKRPRDAGE